MKDEDTKTVVCSLNELSESYVDLMRTIRETTKEAKATKRLWRQGSNSMLIKLGLTLIAFPDPTISDIIGVALVAVGTVQQGIRRRTIYTEDVYKALHDTLKEMWTAQNIL